jgi:glucose/arabinose dehydrogenase/mono/diheme cytochrome c family protein
MSARRALGWFGVFLAVSGLAWAQDDDDDEFRPGVRLTLQVGDAQVHRIERDLELITPPAPASVDPRLPPGPVTATWDGALLIKSDEPLRFHVYLHGQVSITLGGKEVLRAETNGQQWVSGPALVPGLGEQPLHIVAKDFRSVIRFAWSGESFPLEPVPFHALFHSPGQSVPAAIETGRLQWDALGCAACHADGAAPVSRIAPALHAVGEGTTAESLLQRLRRTVPETHSRMPAFGFNAEDAAAITAYLHSVRKDVALPKPPKLGEAKDRAAGTELVKSLGCLACHTWNTLGQSPVWGGGPLETVAAKRQPQWLLQWLTDPVLLNADHRMPVFTLTETERKQIVAALAGDAKPLTVENPPANTVARAVIDRGKRLITEARCASCHAIPDIKAPEERLPGIQSRQPMNTEGCWKSAPDRVRKRPAYRPEVAATIAASLSTGRLQREPESLVLRGRALLVEKNCVACHDRNGGRGLSAIVRDVVQSVPAWEGQAPTLVPPSLTAVGDRMRDDPLALAIKGEQKPRMTWLKVRMPKFRHTQQEVALIARHFIQHDLIPPDPPATPRYPIHETAASADPAVLLAGRELTGGKGFSCVACHALKDYQPPKVALGTRGSDLYQLGERMRPEYFFRWMRSPLRVLPGIEMPGYQRPHPTLLEGKIDRQLAAIWDALHDPNFTAPTNPAVVEQLWALQPGDKPRVLRDVVTIPASEGKTESIPRAVAIGFDNGHSLLFDADTATVRMWTIGDFARQRTQGKSWFWDMAGAPLLQTQTSGADVALLTSPAAGRIQRVAVTGPSVRLLAIESQAATSVLRYRLEWDRKGDRIDALLEERWSATVDGLERSLTVVEAHLPAGVVLGLRQPLSAGLRPTASWESASEAEAELLGRIDDVTYHLLPEAPRSRAFRYRSSLKNPALTVPVVPQPSVVAERITAAPGFEGVRLPLPRTIMPTAMTVLPQGRLAFTSLKGHVFLTQDTDGDGLADGLTQFAEGLAAPYGIIPIDGGLLVAHKPEVVALKDTDQDGRAEAMQIIASGWGYTDDYHDWTCGIVRDAAGGFYIGLGSDYAHKNRPAAQSKWRGHILRFDLAGHVQSIASGLRYPTGLALWDNDQLLCSDQQGVQNCYNELNAIVVGHRYGVPAKLDPPDESPADPPAVQIPHPWTRSVNGIAVWPRSTGHPFAGHIVGAEYNGRFLIRCSLQEVDGGLQGAVYPLTKLGETNGLEEFLGPMSVTFGPQGELYVGSIHDSGWLGGLNTGDIVRLTPNGMLPNGLREVQATPDGFTLSFVHPIDKTKAAVMSAYKVSGATRVWQGTYATDDSGRHTATVQQVTINEDGREVRLTLSGLKPGHVYELNVDAIGTADQPRLWPNTASYFLKRLPTDTKSPSRSEAVMFCRIRCADLNSWWSDPLGEYNWLWSAQRTLQTITRSPRDERSVIANVPRSTRFFLLDCCPLLPIPDADQLQELTALCLGSAHHAERDGD